MKEREKKEGKREREITAAIFLVSFCSFHFFPPPLSFFDVSMRASLYPLFLYDAMKRKDSLSYTKIIREICSGIGKV